jgi:hypothetical protein
VRRRQGVYLLLRTVLPLELPPRADDVLERVLLPQLLRAAKQIGKLRHALSDIDHAESALTLRHAVTRAGSVLTAVVADFGSMTTHVADRSAEGHALGVGGDRAGHACGGGLRSTYMSTAPVSSAAAMRGAGSYSAVHASPVPPTPPQGIHTLARHPGGEQRSGAELIV